jgi:hypothetical protein
VINIGYSADLVYNNIVYTFTDEFVILFRYSIEIRQWTQKLDKTLLHFYQNFSCIFEFPLIIKRNAQERQKWGYILVEVILRGAMPCNLLHDFSDFLLCSNTVEVHLLK